VQHATFFPASAIFERAAQERRPPKRIADVIAEERFMVSRKQAA
jgi:hypothetical protein